MQKKYHDLSTENIPNLMKKSDKYTVKLIKITLAIILLQNK